MKTVSTPAAQNEVLAVTGKGGVGKTTTAAIMTKLLMQEGTLPLVVDADPPVSLTYALGAEPSKTLGLFRKKLIEDPGEKRRVKDSDKHIRELIYDKVLIDARGVPLLVLGRAEGPGCFCGINDLLKYGIQALSERYDITLVDCEAGIEQINRLVVNSVTTLLIVSDASVKGIRTAEYLSQVAAEYGVVGSFRVGLVMNRARREMGPLEKRAEEIGLEIVGHIPEDKNVAEFDLLGKPTLDLPDDSPAVVAVRRMMVHLGLIKDVVTTVKLKGFLTIRDEIGGNGEVELKMANPTVRTALVHISESRGDKLKNLIFAPDATDVRSDTQILVNGRHYRHFQNGLDTKLNEGDLVAIFPAVAGG